MNLTPTFSTGAIGRPTLDPEQERIARLLEALVTQTPGGLVQSTGETLGMVGDVLGSIGQPQRAEALGQQVRRTLPDIVSAVTQRPAEVATAFGQGMEQEVLDKGAGAVFGLEDLILPGGKALGMLGASAMAMGKLPPASKAAQDIVDLSKARQTPRQMRLQELADEQIARGEVPGALERGRLEEEQRKYAGVDVEFAELENQKNRIYQDARQIIKDRKEGKIAKEEADNWIKEKNIKYQDLKKQLSDLATKKDQFRKALEQDQNFINLDDVEKARLDRAVQQGFNVDAFHGTKGDIESFDPGLLGVTTGAPSARRGFFFSADPETANRYTEMADLRQIDPSRYEEMVDSINDEATEYFDSVIREKQRRISYAQKNNQPTDFLIEELRDTFLEKNAYIESKLYSKGAMGDNILPVKLRLQNPLEYDFGGQSYRDVSYNNLLKQAQEAGNDGAIFRNTTDGGGVTDIYVVFEPSQIRSRYAAFDPNEAPTGQSALKMRELEQINDDLVNKAGAYLDDDMRRPIDFSQYSDKALREWASGAKDPDLAYELIKKRLGLKVGGSSLIASAPPILFPLGVGTAAAAYSANQEQ